MAHTVMLHVQHLLGIGHQRRAAAITRELCRQGMGVCYVTGGVAVDGLDIATAELVQLPPAKVSNARFEHLLDAKGRRVDDVWRAQRKRQLLETFHRVRPDALLIETFPFGRKMLSFELQPLLEAAYATHPRPLVVSSIRDILQPKRRERNRQIVELIQRYFDVVLVHGDPQFIALSDSFAAAGAIEGQVEYTGYVVERTPPTPTRRSRGREVLISTGGGYGGEQLLKVALESRRLLEADAPGWRCMVGDNLPDSLLHELRDMAPCGVTLERNRTDFPDLLAGAGVSVSQAGYNTVIEILEAGTPAILVPFAEENEIEQGIRARLLEERGMARLLGLQDLSPQYLLAAIESTRELACVERKIPDTNGAVTTANIIRERVGQSRRAD